MTNRGKILIAGFEEWGPYTSNPASQIVDHLHNQRLQGMKVHGIKLPIDFTNFRTVLRKAIEQVQPSVAYGIGMDFKDAECLHVELEARQLARYGEFSDAHSMQSADITLDTNSQTFVIPHVKKVEQVIQATRLPLKLSRDAGQHMCETVLRDLITMSDNGRKFVPGFIHVPHTPEQLPDSIHFSEHKYAIQLERQIEIVRWYFEKLVPLIG